MFEELMRRVISSWKSSNRRLSVEKGKVKPSTKAKGIKKLTNGAGE